MRQQPNNYRPVVIVGCPRSGTLLTARIVGINYDHFLITEHSNKAICPEDRSGIIDSQLWWQNFEFEKWDDKTKRPMVETPVYNQENISKVRDIYTRLAYNKRLFIKNPAHLTRVNFLKEMFPNALFVFCVRNPWHTLQSMIKFHVLSKDKDFFLLRTRTNYELPDDLLLKTAFSWGEAIDIYFQRRGENWIAVKYEDLIFDTKNAVRRLFNFLGIKDEYYYDKAIQIPRKNTNEYFLIKKYFKKCKFKPEIITSLERGCKYFEYSISPDSVKGKALIYYSRRLHAIIRSLFG